jgi:hypothetical protein
VHKRGKMQALVMPRTEHKPRHWVFLVKEYPMAIILDIAGKPLHPRNNSKKRLRGQDLRDLLKILIILSLIILGYFVFVPGHDSNQSPQALSQQDPRAG